MDTAKEVYEIVSRHSLKKPEALSNELYIEKDLGLAGDDVTELLEEIQRRFEVDFSNFEFSLHFSPEVGWPENPNFGYYPITIGHLVEVAKSKSWFLPEKNKANFLKERKILFILKISIALSIVLVVGAAIFFR